MPPHPCLCSVQYFAIICDKHNPSPLTLSWHIESEWCYKTCQVHKKLSSGNFIFVLQKLHFERLRLTFSNDKLGVAFADTKSFCICSAENLQGNI